MPLTGPSEDGPRLFNAHKIQRVTKKIEAPGVVRVEAWTRFPWLRAGFSTRLGGSSSVYGANDLNLGWTASDSPEQVARNRVRFLDEVSGDSRFKLVTVRQFHSNLIRHIDANSGEMATAEGKAVLRGDALMTDMRGKMLGVQTADCVPILIADTSRKVVAAFHAGWRGTLGRIVQHGIGDLMLRHASEPKDIVAAIGPCISACCFAVGEEVRNAFCSQFAYGEELFSQPNAPSQIYLDLVEANRRQLLDAGLTESNIIAVGECTSCTRVTGNRPKYFSHRAERGFTGRMMSVIGMVEEQI